ncbi:histidinol-phosphate transaminase [Geobacter sp. DSM 9736]|uniref:pyridoxal phosphate-dependent aminotransferase n=1 Tax=Geobacter sp. DSM 9736 TaxID=1277350 RepID=UPI000B50038D|nr:histidinol-phosphate transaminase [Geobacter sp. DSM 9736]SNB46997.1 histidinol-phosphate aminotransferase [Geobacter sp. DSM 9736]
MKAKAYLDDINRFDSSHLDRLSMVRLDRNERVTAWEPEAWEAIRQVITPEVILSYPEFGPVYEKMAAHLDVKPHNLLLTHGSDIALRSIFDVYINAGDEAVMVTPTYAMYPVYAQIVGAKAVEVGFRKDLSLPFSDIRNAITERTRIVCLPNPNQPIERVFNPEEIEEAVHLSEMHDFLLVIDEAYFYFHPHTCVPLAMKHANVIVTRTFSKAFGLAGVRAGLIVADKSRIAEIKKVKPISEINHVAVKLIELLLDNIDWVDHYVEQVNAGREVVLKRAGAMGIQTHGESGNSILLKLNNEEQVRKIVSGAKEQGYLIKGPFEYPADHHVRITLGPPEIMERVMNILERIYQ